MTLQQEQLDVDGMVDKFDWQSYLYVLIPVSGRDHWSLLILEQAMNKTKAAIYHVDSVRGRHDSAQIFGMVKQVLARQRQKHIGEETPFDCEVHAYMTKPLQSNGFDCGVYMLHYMYRTRIYVVKHSPASLQQKMEKLVTGFNASKSAKSHSSLLNALHQASGSS